MADVAVMRPPYAGHYTPTRASHNQYCDGCGLQLIRRGSYAWADDRAEGSLVCGRCVMADPAMYATQTPGQPTVVAPQDGELPGQTTLEEHL